MGGIQYHANAAVPPGIAAAARDVKRDQCQERVADDPPAQHCTKTKQPYYVFFYFIQNHHTTELCSIVRSLHHVPTVTFSPFAPVPQSRIAAAALGTCRDRRSNVNIHADMFQKLFDFTECENIHADIV